tara:strand:- start:256 stop:1278 length:1023 start_codon:yes stop_codon:yes gene_type:complete
LPVLITKEFNPIKDSNQLLPMDEAARMKRAEEMGFNRDVYHGTTQEIKKFNLDLANPESDLGSGIYTTSTFDDANLNYSNIDGQDLTQKIELRAEQLEETYGNMDKAREAAKAELYGGVDEVLKLKARVQNPAYVGGDKKTFLELNQREFDAKDYLDEAKNTTSLDVNDFNNTADYDAALLDEANELGIEDSYNFEPEGELVDLMESIRRQAGSDADDAISTIYNEAVDGGIDADRFIEIVKNSDLAYYEMIDGKNGTNELIRQAFQDAGYDGFIDQGPYNKWGGGSGRKEFMKGINEDTEHIIPFNPNQLRSKDAVFDPSKIDSADLMSSLVKILNGYV